jgi:hypothetical protein
MLDLALAERSTARSLGGGAAYQIADPALNGLLDLGPIGIPQHLWRVLRFGVVEVGQTHDDMADVLNGELSPIEAEHFVKRVRPSA